MTLVFAAFLLLLIGAVLLTILTILILDDARFLIPAGIMLVAAIAIAVWHDEASHRGKVPINCETKSRVLIIGKSVVPQTYKDCDWVTPTP